MISVLSCEVCEDLYIPRMVLPSIMGAEAPHCFVLRCAPLQASCASHPLRHLSVSLTALWALDLSLHALCCNLHPVTIHTTSELLASPVLRILIIVLRIQIIVLRIQIIVLRIQIIVLRILIIVLRILIIVLRIPLCVPSLQIAWQYLRVQYFILYDAGTVSTRLFDVRDSFALP